MLTTFHMQHTGSAANIRTSLISIRIGSHARPGGWGRCGGRWEMKRGFEDSNQTCCDINMAHSSNLVGKIRYDYRECEQRDWCSQSNQRLFEAISRWINTVKFLTLARDAECVFKPRGKGGGIHLNTRYMCETRGACKDMHSKLNEIQLN